jgi:hypothetical protein
VALQFRRYAEKRYVHADGRPTGEAQNFADAMVHLLELDGHSESASSRHGGLPMVVSAATRGLPMNTRR